MDIQLILKGAIAGLIAAAAVDIQAFRSWKSFDEARNYSWPLAAWRWTQGAILGAMIVAGITEVSVLKT